MRVKIFKFDTIEDANEFLEKFRQIYDIINVNMSFNDNSRYHLLIRFDKKPPFYLVSEEKGNISYFVGFAEEFDYTSNMYVSIPGYYKDISKAITFTSEEEAQKSYKITQGHFIKRNIKDIELKIINEGELRNGEI